MTGQRPSQIVGVSDEWAALQFDNAVVLVGTGIENASQEMREVGSGKSKKMVPKYHMDELLDPDFKLPAPPTKEQRERAVIEGLFAMARRGGSNVKVFKAKGDS